MTFEVLTPAYWLVAPLPILALYNRQYAGALRALTGVVLAHLGAVAVLFMGAAIYGAARSSVMLNLAQLAVAVGGVLSAPLITKPLREPFPGAYGVYVVGCCVLNLWASVVGSLALNNDWI